MQSLWSGQEAAQYAGDLGQRIYTSRLPYYKKPPKKDKRELDDEHKVDDYA